MQPKTPGNGTPRAFSPPRSAVVSHTRGQSLCHLVPLHRDIKSTARIALELVLYSQIMALELSQLPIGLEFS